MAQLLDKSEVLVECECQTCRPDIPARRLWFCTSRDGRWCLRGLDSVWDAVSTVHAKQMGTMRTACGLWADTWSKAWDLPFVDASANDVCQLCVDVVHERKQPGTDARQAVAS